MHSWVESHEAAQEEIITFFEKMTTFSTFSNELRHVTHSKIASKLKKNHHISQSPTTDFYFFRAYEKAWFIPLLSQFEWKTIFASFCVRERSLWTNFFYSNCGNVTTLSITSLKYCICEHFWHFFILKLNYRKKVFFSHSISFPGIFLLIKKLEIEKTKTT